LKYSSKISHVEAPLVEQLVDDHLVGARTRGWHRRTRALTQSGADSVLWLDDADPHAEHQMGGYGMEMALKRP
jgi:hypothetical protein